MTSLMTPTRGWVGLINRAGGWAASASLGSGHRANETQLRPAFVSTYPLNRHTLQLHHRRLR